jgi:hypothetical protein
MKIGTEDKKKLMTAGVLGFFAIFAVGYLYYSLFGGPATPPPAPPVIVDKTVPGSGGTTATASVVPGLASPAVTKGAPGKAAVKVATVSGQLDPTLHMEGMLAAEALVYTGTGRNIFAAGPQQNPAPVLEKAKFDARPKGPVGPVVPVNLGPPPPPPINLKFFGVATQKGVRRALLLSGDDVFLASAGDIVQRRYRIVTIAANSITVEDLPNSNQQSLPLTAN